VLRALRTSTHVRFDLMGWIDDERRAVVRQIERPENSLIRALAPFYAERMGDTGGNSPLPPRGALDSPLVILSVVGCWSRCGMRCGGRRIAVDGSEVQAIRRTRHRNADPRLRGRRIEAPLRIVARRRCLVGNDLLEANDFCATVSTHEHLVDRCQS